MISCKRVRTPFVRTSKIYTQRQSPSAEAIANNYDLLTKILGLLPIKSLLQFKSVSKGWHSLISDHKFYRCIFPHISGLITRKRDDSLDNIAEHYFIPLSNKSSSSDATIKFLIPTGLEVVQSCHGLLLCCSNTHNDFRSDYYIYNPTTKQFVTLPRPANSQKTRKVYPCSLAFDPTKSPHYKVVCVRNSNRWVDLGYGPKSRYMKKQVEIYSSQTRSWRLSGKPFIAPYGTRFEFGFFCNGAIHWPFTNNISLYFNLGEERVGELPMPSISDDDSRRGTCIIKSIVYYTECGGHLHFIKYRPPNSTFNVYEIETDYSGWFLKYHIDLDSLTRTCFVPSDYVFNFLCMVREVNDEGLCIVFEIPDKAIRYNLKDGSFKTICDFPPIPNDNDDDYDFDAINLISWRYNAGCHQFIQTLVSV